MNINFSKIKTIIWKSSLGFLVISIASVLVFKWVPIYVTPLMIIRCVEQKIDGKPMKLDKQWKPIEEISPNLQLAVFCTEDQNFLNHNGFDIEAIKKALEHNKTGKRKRGASTISQQVAKNVFLWDGRNWIRKGLEVYFTFLIETFWSKERIMEVYLNVIEMGLGVYGAEAASHYYFNTTAIELNKNQAAAIAIGLPSPRKYNIVNPNRFLQKRINWALRQMNYIGGELEYNKKS